jgi:hypothetical protein
MSAKINNDTEQESKLRSYAKTIKGITRDDIKNNIKSFMQTDINTDFLVRIYRTPKYLAILEFVQFIIFLIIVYVFNPFKISTAYPIYAQLGSIIVAFLLIMLFYFLRNLVDVEKMDKLAGVVNNVNQSTSTETAFLIKLLDTFLAFIAFVFFAKLLFWLFSQGNMSQIISAFCSFVLIVGVLGILYLWLAPKLNKAKLDSQTSLLGFTWKFVMYIPCLLLIFLDYLKKEYHITTKPVWMILGIETAVVFLWFVLPKLLHKAATIDGIQLLRDPVYLNLKQVVRVDALLLAKANKAKARDSDKDKMKLNEVNGVLEENKRTYAYSLSAWFYINPQPPNTGVAYTQYTPILNYGEKPIVEFNSQKNTLRVRALKGKAREYPLHNTLQTIVKSKRVPLQKWNYIVLNYDRGFMDVFLNGELIGSKPGIAPYMKTRDNVEIGHRNGIQGGVCNVMYFDEILQQQSIIQMYKLLRDKKNPVI